MPTSNHRTGKPCRRPNEPAETLPAPLGRRSRWLLPGLILLVAGAVAATHWPVLTAQALAFDDDVYLRDNVLVRRPGLESTRRFLTEVLHPSTVGGYYQPLAMISIMLDYAAGGRPADLRQFHRTNLAMHTLNAVLVLLLLQSLFGRPWISAALALLFGLHPMSVESVAWLAERKTLLATAFALLSLLAYLRFTRRRRWPAYAGSLGLYVLALLSKPTSTPLPLLMLVLDYWPLRRLTWRSAGKVAAEKLPFLAIGGVSAVVTFLSQAATSNVVLPTQQSPLRIPLVVCHNVVWYLRHFLWPTDLSPNTVFPDPLSVSNPVVLAGLLGTAMLVVCLVLSWRRTPALVSGAAFFFLAVLPSLGIVGFAKVIASDKYAYLANIGWLLPLAWGLDRLWTLAAKSNPARAWQRPAIVVASLAVLAAAGVASRRQLAYWQTCESLAARIVSLSPNDVDSRVYYATSLVNAGKVEQAERQFTLLLEKAPDDAAVQYNYGAFLAYRGRRSEAIQAYRRALDLGGRLSIHRDRYLVLCNLANELIRERRFEDALQPLDEAVRIRPDGLDARILRGDMRFKLDRFQDAADDYAAAIHIDATRADAHDGLGVACARLGRPEEAIKHFREAIRLSPRLARAHHNLGFVLMEMERPVDAVAVLRAGLEIEPNDTATRRILADALRLAGQPAEAAAEYRQVLQANPDSADAHFGLGAALEQLGIHEAAEAEFKAALELRPTDAGIRQRLEAIQSRPDSQP